MATDYTELTSLDRKANPAAAAIPHVPTAMAILRTVSLAADALEDRSVQHEDQAGPERWGAAVGMNATNEPNYWHPACQDPGFAPWMTRYLLCWQANNPERVAARYMRSHPPKPEWIEAFLTMVRDRCSPTRVNAGSGE